MQLYRPGQTRLAARPKLESSRNDGGSVDSSKSSSPIQQEEDEIKPSNEENNRLLKGKDADGGGKEGASGQRETEPLETKKLLNLETSPKFEEKSFERSFEEKSFERRSAKKPAPFKGGHEKREDEKKGTGTRSVGKSYSKQKSSARYEASGGTGFKNSKFAPKDGPRKEAEANNSSSEGEKKTVVKSQGKRYSRVRAKMDKNAS